MTVLGSIVSFTEDAGNAHRTDLSATGNSSFYQFFIPAPGVIFCLSFYSGQHDLLSFKGGAFQQIIQIICFLIVSRNQAGP